MSSASVLERSGRIEPRKIRSLGLRHINCQCFSPNRCERYRDGSDLVIEHNAAIVWHSRSRTMVGRVLNKKNLFRGALCNSGADCLTAHHFRRRCREGRGHRQALVRRLPIWSRPIRREPIRMRRVLRPFAHNKQNILESAHGLPHRSASDNVRNNRNRRAIETADIVAYIGTLRK